MIKLRDVMAVMPQGEPVAIKYEWTRTFTCTPENKKAWEVYADKVVWRLTTATVYRDCYILIKLED